VGERRSGKSTLLRIAAGIDVPDEGTIRFEGHDLTALSAGKRAKLVRPRVAWIGEPALPVHNVKAVRHVALPLLVRGLGPRKAERFARRALQSIEMLDRAETPVHSLSLVDRLRVALAQALMLDPSLLLVDEPAVMPSEREVRRFLDLLRSSASERGMTLMVASETLSALRDLDVVMSIGEGEVHPIERREAAEVIDFPAQRAAGKNRSNDH
jgi:predicted ABC-type transport system involved in lysophospholipase L1 biosynthesis ATPase subunit